VNTKIAKISRIIPKLEKNYIFVKRLLKSIPDNISGLKQSFWWIGVDFGFLLKDLCLIQNCLFFFLGGGRLGWLKK